MSKRIQCGGHYIPRVTDVRPQWGSPVTKNAFSVKEETRDDDGEEAEDDDETEQEEEDEKQESDDERACKR